MTKPAIVFGPYKDGGASIRCPKCKVVGVIDRDQFIGRISMVCPTPGCGFHETHDMRAP